MCEGKIKNPSSVLAFFLLLTYFGNFCGRIMFTPLRESPFVGFLSEIRREKCCEKKYKNIYFRRGAPYSFYCNPLAIALQPIYSWKFPISLGYYFMREMSKISTLLFSPSLTRSFGGVRFSLMHHRIDRNNKTKPPTSDKTFPQNTRKIFSR